MELTFRDKVRRVSLLGVLRSLRLTGSPDKLVVGRGVETTIDPEAQLDIRSRLEVGVRATGAAHPAMGGSKLWVGPDAEVAVTCDDGGAWIGPCSAVHVEGSLSLGCSYLNGFARIVCADGIRVGDGCAIAWNVDLVDTDRHRLTVDGEARDRTAPIEIQDHVWIGHHATIAKGVTVGEDAVVASHAVVTRDVPAGALVAGCPAEVVHEDVGWD